MGVGQAGTVNTSIPNVGIHLCQCQQHPLSPVKLSLGGPGRNRIPCPLDNSKAPDPAQAQKVGGRPKLPK